jgi:hypothetical protein
VLSTRGRARKQVESFSDSGLVEVRHAQPPAPDLVTEMHHVSGG